MGILVAAGKALFAHLNLRKSEVGFVIHHLATFSDGSQITIPCFWSHLRGANPRLCLFAACSQTTATSLKFREVVVAVEEVVVVI